MRFLYIVDKHKEHEWPVLLAADINKLWKIVKTKRLCFGCLGLEHKCRQCIALKCAVNSCVKVHNKLLHGTSKLPAAPEQKGVDCGKAQANAACLTKVALETVVVPLNSDFGKIVRRTVLLDFDSETSLIRT